MTRTSVRDHRAIIIACTWVAAGAVALLWLGSLPMPSASWAIAQLGVATALVCVVPFAERPLWSDAVYIAALVVTVNAMAWGGRMVLAAVTASLAGVALALWAAFSEYSMWRLRLWTLGATSTLLPLYVWTTAMALELGMSDFVWWMSALTWLTLLALILLAITLRTILGRRAPAYG